MNKSNVTSTNSLKVRTNIKAGAAEGCSVQ